MTDFTQDLFARRRNASDGNTRVVSAGRLWYDSITNSLRVSDGHTPGGQIVTGQSGAYTLPTATPSVKGGVQLGSNIIATGASIDVLQPTRVSQLENDSNYLSGSVLSGYATETYVTTRGYITSAALASGNANVIAANSRITSLDANIGAYHIYANTNINSLNSNAGAQATSINRLDANIGAYGIWANSRISTLDANLGTTTTNINNIVAQANANTTAWLQGSVTTGPLTASQLTINNVGGGYFANISAYGRPMTGQQSWRFFVNDGIGGPGSWLSFPDSTNQFTAYPGTATTLDTFDANIGTLYLGNLSLQANLGAFQTWANSKIGTNASGNLVVDATTTSTGATTGALVVKGGAGFAGNIWSGNAYIGSHLDNYLQINGNNSPGSPSLIPQGSDASISLNLYSKGISGVVGMYTNSVKQFDVYGPANSVNYVRASGAIAGAAPYVQAQGSATNVDMAVAAKNDGNLVFTGGNVVTSLTGNINLGANLRVYSTASSVSSATGGLIVQGGVGVTGNVNASGNITASNVIATHYGNSIGTTATYSGNLITSNLNVNSQATITFQPPTTTGAALTILAGNTKGGTGYNDFLAITNTSGGATDPSKWFRVNTTGELQIINSAYTSQLLVLSDAGDMSIAGNISQSGIRPGYSANRPGFRVYGATTSTWNTAVNTGGYMNSNQWTVDYNQGSYLNNSTGVFTAPVAGLYQVNLNARFAGNSTSISQACIIKNATSGNGGGGTISLMLEFAQSSTMNHAGVSTALSLAVNDTLVLKVTAGTIQFDSNDSWSVAYLG